MATKVITGKVRASFVHIFEPQSVNGSDPGTAAPSSSPRATQRPSGKIRAAIEEAKQSGVTKWGGKISAEPEAAPARRRHRPPRRSQLRWRLLRQRQPATSGPAWWTAGAVPITDPAGGVLRLLCPGIPHLLSLQHQRQPWRRLRVAEHSEVVATASR